MARPAKTDAMRLLPIDSAALASWLPSLNENGMTLLLRIFASRSAILAPPAAGHLECRYAILTDGRSHLLKIEVVREGREIPFGSITLCLDTGTLFRTYAIDEDAGGRREARLHFDSFEDATRYLIFASRAELKAAGKLKLREKNRRRDGDQVKGEMAAPRRTKPPKAVQKPACKTSSSPSAARLRRKSAHQQS